MRLYFHFMKFYLTILIITACFLCTGCVGLGGGDVGIQLFDSERMSGYYLSQENVKTAVGGMAGSGDLNRVTLNEINNG